jgi:hypothetical protein
MTARRMWMWIRCCVRCALCAGFIFASIIYFSEANWRRGAEYWPYRESRHSRYGFEVAQSSVYFGKLTASNWMESHGDLEAVFCPVDRGFISLEEKDPGNHSQSRSARRGFLGVALVHEVWNDGSAFDGIVASLWLVTSASGILAGVSCVAVGPRRRPKKGDCAVCGYDLRAHRPGQRCPECGTPIPLDKTGDRPSGKDLEPPETDPPGEPSPPG